jgi:hypothetical protein
MNGLRREVFGEDENPDIYNDPEYRDALTAAVKALPEPQIQGKIIQTTQVTGKQFRFMGQRYTLDADILQTLMEPIIRPIPTSLDVMGVLGSSTAEDILLNDYKSQDTWNKTPAMKEEAFMRLQEVMQEAGELKELAPFDKLVDNTFADKAVKK